MRKIRNPIGQVSLSAIEDQWQRDATAAALAAVRSVIQMDGPIPPGTPVGRLSDTEWGWIIAGALFAWDRQARRAGGGGAARHRAMHPHDRPRPATMGRGRGRGDPARAR
jgi:hypothetical protein